MAGFADNEYLFTSESVTEGHPDKVSDQISDGVLDAVLAQDPYGRVACETLVNTGLVVISGEISTTADFDPQEVARETIRKIGYVDGNLGFSADSAAVLNALDKQSSDIAQGVDAALEAREGSDDEAAAVAGAGDQGMMFGYASNETPELMPAPISLAHRLAEKLAAVRKDGSLGYLRPDGKTQVSVRYVDGRPVAVEKLLISTQHAEEATREQITSDLWEQVVVPVIPADLYDANTLKADFLVNPTGRFVIGGPVGDAGLTGRKIIVDTYGGFARHGGGAFSGKDPSQGRPLRRLRGALGGQEHRGRRPGRPLRGAGRLRDRRRAPGQRHGRDLRHREDRPRHDRPARRRALRPAPRRLPRGAQPPPPHLPEDRRLRPLRPRRRRLHLGADQQGRRAARGGRPLADIHALFF